MRILVTGATGMLGRALVPALVRAGHQVRALSRTRRESRGNVEWVWGDLFSGHGVPEAVAGMDAVAHLATSGRKGRGAVDVPGTRLLLLAAGEAGVGHLLLTSMVGADRAPVGHLKDKLEAERLVAGSGLGWTVLRSTLFHQWLHRRLRDLAAFPVLPVDPTVLMQPVHTGEVAARAAGLLAEGPLGAAVEFGGPQVLGHAELARTWCRLRSPHRLCLPIRFPGRLYAAQRDGALTTDATPAGTITWHDYLAPPADPATTGRTTDRTTDRRTDDREAIHHMTTADRRTSDRETDDHRTRNSTTRNSTTQNGTTQDGTTQDGTTQDRAAADRAAADHAAADRAAGDPRVRASLDSDDSGDFATEHTASPTSPANQPERDPDARVYGGDDGYEHPTRD
ncbi:SDR family oxidoreductase [Nonomuraea sp. NPDC050783]|uniref:SDR family oxidoreductase n=1 Tax=Nonomuraea sp. NPDC050783 TaxID=3154634 RepID=UPI0034677B24